MKPTKGAQAVEGRMGLRRNPNGSITLSVKGIKNGRVTVTDDPSKPNGHPKLFACLDALLEASSAPFVLQVDFVGPGGTKTAGPRYEIPSYPPLGKGRRR